MSSASPDHRQKTTSAPSPIGLRAPALRPRSVARSPALSPATMMRAGCARSASLWCCGRVGRRPSSMPTRYVCRPPVGSWWPGFSYAGGWEGVELCTDSAGADVPVRALLLAGGNSRSRRPGPRTAPHAARRHRPRGVHTARRARRSTGRAGLTWGHRCRRRTRGPGQPSLSVSVPVRTATAACVTAPTTMSRPWSSARRRAVRPAARSSGRRSSAGRGSRSTCGGGRPDRTPLP